MASRIGHGSPGGYACAALFALLAFAPLARSQTEETVSEPVRKILAFDARNVATKKEYRIAVLAECPPPGGLRDRYCQARLEGLRAAAKKYGFEFEIYFANFNPEAQRPQVEESVAQEFDGYVFAPTAADPGCAMWTDHLVPTGKPVVSVDLPMCNDPDHTPGLAATVLMQSQAYYDADVEFAFRTCERPCYVAAVGGFDGSGLFQVWRNAIERASTLYPDVHLLVDEPGNFDWRVAREKVRQGLRNNPEINVVLSAWDEMSRGVEQAIRSAHKLPGRDVRIYSMGATRQGVAKVAQGIYFETTVLLPWEEGYYSAVAVVAALEGEPLDGFVNEAELPRVTEGPGSILLTRENVSLFEPNY
ncbi:MAG TPA: sugar ABC transporter substrate-binding protein [Vicinamibacteria bacterium]|nr:sugar ABC transporter substrate-binding protein [Vicinamibacteria bacterium]